MIECIVPRARLPAGHGVVGEVDPDHEAPVHVLDGGVLDLRLEAEDLPGVPRELDDVLRSRRLCLPN